MKKTFDGVFKSDELKDFRFDNRKQKSLMDFLACLPSTATKTCARDDNIMKDSTRMGCLIER